MKSNRARAKQVRSLTAIVAISGIFFGSIVLSSKRGTAAPRKLSFSEKVEYDLPLSATRWCKESSLPALNYHDCDGSGIVYEINFQSGFKMILLSVIKAFEDNRCFYITHQNLLQEDQSDASSVAHQNNISALDRYTEPIGLSESDPIVIKAKSEGRVKVLDWLVDVWEIAQNRRSHKSLHNISSLEYWNLEGTFLKKVMLQRMWRLQPSVRATACLALQSHLREDDDFLALGIHLKPRTNLGLKPTYIPATPNEYVLAAEQAIAKDFASVVPKIFVATNDCRVMDTLRRLRQNWTFVSECDDYSNFHATTRAFQTLEQADRHFRKFFVELFGIASAKIYLGTGYTNMAWWAFLMREDRWSTRLLDEPNQYDTIDTW